MLHHAEGRFQERMVRAKRINRCSQIAVAVERLDHGPNRAVERRFQLQKPGLKKQMCRQILAVGNGSDVRKIDRFQRRAVLSLKAGRSTAPAQIAEQAHARSLTALERRIFQKRCTNVGLQLTHVQLQDLNSGKQLRPLLLYGFLLLEKLHENTSLCVKQ